ncbi:MAG: MFS transporter [Dehalococcoidia bacterium]
MDTETKRFSLRQLRTFDSLKNPVYRLYFGGIIGQMAAMNMEMMARNLLIYRVTGSATILGLMTLSFAGPMLLFSLFGGIIADRMHKKHILLVGQLISAVVSLGVALSLTLGYLGTDYGGSWWILIVAAVCQGTIMSLTMPSRWAMLREIVHGEQLLNAVSLYTVAMNGFRVLGPAVAGFLIDAFDFAVVYYFMTGLHLVSAIFIFFLPLTSLTVLPGRGALFDIKEGLNYVRHEPIIFSVLAFSLLGVVLGMPYVTLMPIFTEDILKVGAAELGMLMSTAGIGAIVGSLILASLPNRKRGLLLLMSALCLGVALVGFVFSSSWYLALSLLIFVGLGQSGLMALGNTLLQHYSTDEYRGRVMSIFAMEMGLMSFGAVGAALLTESIGVQWAIGSFGISMAFLSILTLAFVPQLRELD